MEAFDHHRWRELSKHKEIRPENLSTLIKPGSKIFIATACSEPYILTKELVHDKYRWTDCELIHFLTVSDQKFFSEHYPTRFRHNTLSIIGSDQIRKAINEGKSDYTPIRSSEIPALLKSRGIVVDVALLQVSPPDKYGFCSFGINVDINIAVAQVAKKIIAQINPQMPYTRGDSSIKFEEIHYYFYHESEILEYPEITQIPENFLESYQKIGQYLGRIIENGSTLNIGFGRLPNSIWQYLKDKSDLAVYSEMLGLTPDLFKLINSGVINCKKNAYSNIMASFALGTRDLYALLDQNPFIKFFPTEFLNDPRNIAKNHKLCSIYSAISVDLTGQITNHLPNRLYGGIGGEPDFIQGRNLSQDGKTIIILPSTSSDGKYSRIIPFIERGIVSDYDVHYVITEWGIARLAGKSIRGRTLQLIGIAHPDFRKQLLQEAKELHYIYEDQIIPTTKDGVVVVYPERCEWIFVCNSEETLNIRPVKPTDEVQLQRFFYSLNEKDRNLRFLTPKATFTHEDAQFEVNIDYDTTMALIATKGDEINSEVFGVVSYYKDPSGSTNMAEIAFVLSSQHQGHGLGRFLFDKMCEIAQEKGVAGFVGEVFAENIAMLRLLQSLPFRVSFDNYGETLEFSLKFSERKKR